MIRVKMKKGTKLIVGTCIAVLGVFLGWGLVRTITWDGTFDLPITVLDGGKPVDRAKIKTIVYSYGVPRSETNDPLYASPYPLLEARYDGEAYIADVPCHGTSSGLGFFKSSGQFHALFIKLELIDGRSISLVTPVSDKKHDPRVILDIEALMHQEKAGGPNGVKH